MARILPAAECFCGVCDGGQKVPEGYFGGSVCVCRCHSLTGKELEDYLAAEKERLRKLIQERFKMPER